MVPFFMSVSLVCGGLAIWTGSPWYLLPQVTYGIVGTIIMAVRIREQIAKDAAE